MEEATGAKFLNSWTDPFSADPFSDPFLLAEKYWFHFMSIFFLRTLPWFLLIWMEEPWRYFGTGRLYGRTLSKRGIGIPL